MESPALGAQLGERIAPELMGLVSVLVGVGTGASEEPIERTRYRVDSQ